MTPEPDQAPADTDLPPVPAAAEHIYGAALPTAERYVAILADSGVTRGLIGPREVPRLWERHVLNCAVVTELIAQDASVIDVGSGAGLPGLAMAIRRPDLHITLVEPLLRRVTWLHEVIEDLDLPNVDVERGRAEELWDVVPPADVVTSRAVSALDKLGLWSLPLVRPGGLWLPMKGSSVAEEIAAGDGVLRKAGATAFEVVECGVGVLEPPTTVAKVTVGTPRRLTGSKRSGKKGKAPSARAAARTARRQTRGQGARRTDRDR